MTYYLIIRGPLGCGKSTIAKQLCKKINAKYISMDEIVDNNRIIKKPDKNGMIDVRNFLQANKILLPTAIKYLEKNNVVIIDGCFYHKKQIIDLMNKLNPYKLYIFDLIAPLEVCIERDKNRNNCFGKDAAKAVYNAVSKFSMGTRIDTTKKIPTETIKEILRYLPRQ